MEIWSRLKDLLRDAGITQTQSLPENASLFKNVQDIVKNQSRNNEEQYLQILMALLELSLEDVAEELKQITGQNCT